MYQMLIVDDEPYIVDSLYDLFSEVVTYEIEVYRAYSANEAISWLKKTKIDIVLSDIKMPGMTGIELFEKIKNYWSDCKVIFLTGYDNFEYIQKAIRYGGVDYILKTEDDDVIVAAVENALDIISKTKEVNVFVNNAEQQMRLAEPFIKQELFLSFIRGESTMDKLNKELKETTLSIDMETPCLLVLGRIDDINESWNTLIDYSNYLLAVDKIGSNFLSDTCHYKMFHIDKFRFYWLIQPITKNSIQGFQKSINKKLKSIQDECKRTLGISISFVFSANLISWAELPKKFGRLETIITLGMSHRQKVLVTDEQYEIEFQEYTYGSIEGFQIQNKHLSALVTYLESGKQTEFNHYYKQLIDVIKTSPYPIYMEFYYLLVSIVMTQANRLSLYPPFLIQIYIKHRKKWRTLQEIMHLYVY